MLPRRQEEGSVDERVAVENDQIRVAKNTRDPVRLGRHQRSQDEIPRVVIPMSLILHL